MLAPIRAEADAASHPAWPAPITITSKFNYRCVSGFSAEMVERFERYKPTTFGEARRIRGLTPSALSLLLVSLKNDVTHKKHLEQ